MTITRNRSELHGPIRKEVITGIRIVKTDHKENKMLDIHKDVPLHRWKVVTLRDGSQTICFNHGGGCIYDVPVWELEAAEGLNWWLKHLRRKIWFAETEEQFWEALREGNFHSLASQGP